MDTLAATRKALRHRSPVRRALSGAYCVVQGALLTLRSPHLLQRALIPVLVNLALYPLFGYLAWSLLAPLHAWLFQGSGPEGFWGAMWTVASWLAWVLLALVTGLTALMMVSVVGASVASPLLETLTANVEAVLTKRNMPPGPGMWETVLHAIRGQVVFLILYALSLVLGLALCAIPGLGAFIGPLFQAGITLGFMAIQYMEWSADRRRMGVWGRFRIVRRNQAACLGFGAAAWIMMLFPFTLPFVAVGGTLLFLSLADEPVPVDPLRP